MCVCVCVCVCVVRMLQRQMVRVNTRPCLLDLDMCPKVKGR